MARKTHVIGYRLGESRWWETRTANSDRKAEIREKVEEYLIIKKVIKGVMKKYGMIVGGIQLEERVEETGVEQRIKMVGARAGEGQRGKIKRRGRWGKGIAEKRPRATVAVYAQGYIKELIETYIRKGVEMSYREEKESQRNATIVRAMIEDSSRGMLVTMRKIKREVGRVMTNNQKKYKRGAGRGTTNSQKKYKRGAARVMTNNHK